MLTKLETILVCAIFALTIDNALLATYVMNPSVILMYCGFAAEGFFFLIMTYAIIHFFKIKNRRVVAGE